MADGMHLTRNTLATHRTVGAAHAALERAHAETDIPADLDADLIKARLRRIHMFAVMARTNAEDAVSTLLGADLDRAAPDTPAGEVRDTLHALWWTYIGSDEGDVRDLKARLAEARGYARRARDLLMQIEETAADRSRDDR